MTQLLLVETSVRGDQSVSRQMSRRFLAAWQTRNPQGRVVERDLVRTSLSFVTQPWLRAYFTPLADQSEVMRHELKVSDELVAELLAADHLVISTPVYIYTIPALLKAWVDYIVRKGATLRFDGGGLVKGKKATVLLASGGAYTDFPPFRIATSRHSVYVITFASSRLRTSTSSLAGAPRQSTCGNRRWMDSSLPQPQIDRAASPVSLARKRGLLSLARAEELSRPLAYVQSGELDDGYEAKAVVHPGLSTRCSAP